MANLLIVDDENDVREFAANFFRRRKINVTTAASGEDALLLLEKMVPDLILLDIKMTGIDGIETLRRIRQKGIASKVIMVTGKKPDEEGSLEKCKEYTVSAYVHKPLELDELESIVVNELK